MADTLGNVTLTETFDSATSVKKIKAVWASGIGNYNGLAWNTTAEPYDGRVLMAVTIPGTGTPANAYNIRAYDSDGVDILASGCLARSNVLTQAVLEASLGAVSRSKLNIYIQTANVNAASANGTAYLYIR